MLNWSRLSILLALVIALMPTAALSVDPGTGLDPTDPGSTLPGDVREVQTPQTIGYTTNSVVAHYRTLDDAEFSTGRSDIIAEGHTLVPINSLNPGDLVGIDRLIIGVVAPGSTLTQAQMDVVWDFVLAGGDLVFIGENNNFFRDNNVVVGGRFGITYPSADPPETILTDVGIHPIMQGPYGNVTVVDGSNNSSGFYGSMLSPGPNGASILNFPGGSSGCVVIEPEALGPTSGPVVAVAEVNVWDNSQMGAGSNRIFWDNIFAWTPENPTAARTGSWGAIKASFK